MGVWVMAVWVYGCIIEVKDAVRLALPQKVRVRVRVSLRFRVRVRVSLRFRVGVRVRVKVRVTPTGWCFFFCCRC